MATSLLSPKGYLNSFVNVSASATGSGVVTALTGKKIRVHALGLSCGGTASTVVFNYGADAAAGTAISPIFNNSISLPFNEVGWFETAYGQGLTATTGSGSTSAVLIVYSIVS